MFYFSICVHNLPATQREREKEKTLFIYLSQCIIFKRFFFHQEAKSVKYPQANKTKEGKKQTFFLLCILYRIPDLLSCQWLLF